MIQWKDGTHPQVFCSHDITMRKIDNFKFFIIVIFEKNTWLVYKNIFQDRAKLLKSLSGFCQSGSFH